jgi:hypothetical protein
MKPEMCIGVKNSLVETAFFMLLGLKIVVCQHTESRDKYGKTFWGRNRKL